VSAPLTVIALIEQAAAQLDQAGVAYGHGTTNSFDEAAWLVLWRLGLPLDSLDDVADRSVSPEEQAAVDALVKQRIATRKPAAYLTRQAWLQGVPFYVDERVIVPRSFIAEVLADGSIDAWLSDRTHRVLDLCTGNGSLAVLAAMAYPDVTVDAPTSAKTRWPWPASTSSSTACRTASRCCTATGCPTCGAPTTSSSATRPTSTPNR